MTCPRCGGPIVHCWRHCIRRAIAFAVVAMSCSVGIAGGNPSLLLFTDPANCRPCRLFDRDWSTDKAFRDAVTKCYAIVPSYQPATHPQKFREYQITAVPTWVIVSKSGQEVGRVSGYTTPTDLWVRLRNATKNTPRSQPPAASPPPSAGSVPDPSSDVLRRLDEANKLLESERDSLRAEMRALEKRLLDAQKNKPQTPDRSPEIDAMQKQLQVLQKQIQRRDAEAALAAKRLQAAEQLAANAAAEAERLRQRAALPDAPDWVQQEVDKAHATPETPPPVADTEQPQTLPTPANPDTTGGRWLTLLKTLGGGLLTLAAPELVVPAGLALGAAGLAVRWRNQRRAAASPAQNFPVSQPSLPRDNNEIEQILSLRQQEQREPIHDAFFGVLFEDEYRSNPDKPIREAWASALDRFNNVAPLSTRTTTTTTTAKG